MPEDTIVDQSQDVTAEAVVAPVVQSVNPDTLKALLLILGHKIEDEWEHIVALSKKVA